MVRWFGLLWDANFEKSVLLGYITLSGNNVRFQGPSLPPRRNNAVSINGLHYVIINALCFNPNTDHETWYSPLSPLYRGVYGCEGKQEWGSGPYLCGGACNMFYQLSPLRNRCQWDLISSHYEQLNSQSLRQKSIENTMGFILAMTQDIAITSNQECLLCVVIFQTRSSICPIINGRQCCYFKKKLVTTDHTSKRICIE